MDCIDDIKAVVTGRLKAELIAQSVEKAVLRSLNDTDGTVALNVAVSTYRAGSCAWLSEVPLEQE